MGGQMGGMVNEAGHFPEVCKKSLQAAARLEKCAGASYGHSTFAQATR